MSLLRRIGTFRAFAVVVAVALTLPQACGF
jgi:hypothetical protein